MPVRIELFGPPRVRRDGVAVRFDTRKAVALLALLAVTAKDFARGTLAGMLWPELERPRARATLRRTLSVATAVGPALIMDADRVSLDADSIECDVVEFRRLTASADPAHWRRAASLAASPFLDGFSLRDSPLFDEWVLGVAENLRDDLSRTLARLVADAVSRRDWAAALDLARRRVQVEPLSEPAHTDLIRVSAWSGDRSGALQSYRSLVRLLDRDLGVTPLPATLALHEDIRADRLVPPAETSLGTRAVDAAKAQPRAPLLPALVGREDELARLRRMWAETGASGRVVGIVGESGFGKSAMLDAVAQEIDAVVLRVTGHSAEKTLAFAAAIDFVRGMLDVDPELAERVGPAAAPLAALSSHVGGSASRGIRTPGDLQRVHAAARVALENLARGRPVLLCIDDAQHLDTPSAILLSYIARRLPAGVLAIVTWAPHEQRGPLARAVLEGGECMVLPPFGIRQIAELDPGLDPNEVLRATNGVPLLVREFASAPSSADTDGVRDIVAARFAGASDVARQVVTAAVVLGAVAPPDLLRVVSGRDEAETVEAIEEAVSQRLLVESSSGYAAPHHLVRDAALSGLSLARRRLLHSRIADALVRRHATDPLATPAGSIARHLADAGREEAAAAWFVRAAEESIRLSAYEEAIVQLREAMARGRTGADTRTRIGVALVRLGRYDEALVSLDQAAATAGADEVRLAEIEHLIADVHDRLGDWPLAQAHLRAACELSEDDHRRARVLADLALVLHRQGLAAQARDAATEAAGAATDAGDRGARAQADNVLGMLALADGDLARAKDLLGSAVARARVSDEDLLIAALNNLSRALAAGGSDVEALATAREALELAERRGDRHRLAALHSHAADLLHATGLEEEAMVELKRSAAAFAAISGSSGRPEVWTLMEW